MKKLLNIAAAAGLALVMGAPVYAVQTTYNPQTGITTTSGRITMIAREGDRYRVQLDNGAYTYWVPLAALRDGNLQVGDFVTLSGPGQNSAWRIDTMAPVYEYAPNGMPSGTLVGIVQNTNRHLNYVTARDEATGRWFKVDVRNMNTRRSVNVWRLRPGDRIVVNGGWENRNTFQADTVNFQ